MKNHAIAIFLAAWLLFLAAHTGFAPAVQPAYEEPDYQFEELAARETYSGGGASARWSCQLLLLTVPNLERLSPEDRLTAERNMENFNGRMRGLMDACKDRGARLKDELPGGGGFCYDETAAGCTLTGQIISVRLDNSGYTGGAHPNRYTEGLLFDLQAGQFADPAQIADDPASFLKGAAELLLEKAEAHPAFDSFWQDYADLIARWNEGTVLFDGEGMAVIYSPYEIAPYGMGQVELRLDWTELAELMGPGGLAKLGVELPGAAG